MLAGPAPADLDEALRETLSAYLLVREDDRYAFRHALATVAV